MTPIPSGSKSDDSESPARSYSDSFPNSPQCCGKKDPFQGNVPVDSGLLRSNVPFAASFEGKMFVRLNASPSGRRGMAVRGAFTIPSMSTNNPCFSFVRLNAPPVFVRLNATPPILTVAFTFTIDTCAFFKTFSIKKLEYLQKGATLKQRRPAVSSPEDNVPAPPCAAGRLSGEPL